MAELSIYDKGALCVVGADCCVRPVGYTEDDVRLLAEWVRGAYPHVCFGVQPNALAPFRALLDGGPDAKA